MQNDRTFRLRPSYKFVYDVFRIMFWSNPHVASQGFISQHPSVITQYPILFTKQPAPPNPNSHIFYEYLQHSVFLKISQEYRPP